MSTVYHAQAGSLIILPLAGVPENNISITAEEDILHISVSTQKQTRKYILHEREENFDHTFKLKPNTNPELIEAKLKNGLLTLYIPLTKTHKEIKIIAA